MKEKDATFLIKSMISEVCSSPDLSVSKNLHKNLVMSAVEEIVGQQLLSPRPRFERWQARESSFSSLGLHQIIFLLRL